MNLLIVIFLFAVAFFFLIIRLMDRSNGSFLWGVISGVVFLILSVGLFIEAPTVKTGSLINVSYENLNGTIINSTSLETYVFEEAQNFSGNIKNGFALLFFALSIGIIITEALNKGEKN